MSVVKKRIPNTVAAPPGPRSDIRPHFQHSTRLFFQTYPSPYSIDDKASATFMVLAGVCDENRHLGVLMEDLLYATVVHAPSKIPMTGLLSIVRLSRFLVTQVILMGQVIRRVLAGRVTRWRGRGGLAVKQSCTIVSTE